MHLTTRRDKAQCNVKRHAGWQLTPSSYWMKVECRGAIANARAPKASKNFDHLFHYCGSAPSRSAIKSTTPNTTGRGIRELGHSTTSGAPNADCSYNIPTPQSRGGAKDISMDHACKVRSARDFTSCLRCCALAHEAFHKESRTTNATPIVSQSALRAVWAAHQ